ncbi:hypothetical protein [Vibrio alginolyticus]|uniref:hypothetical protein n=1 Tax=Vibrio alginolyticus TaxID=663 RepID=UPI0006CA8603|nr:hypothetical protein [Vibrio alginolyticus]KPM97505.1 hypothetical protein AOG25_13620 [Vibrio alginolyticus]
MKKIIIGYDFVPEGSLSFLEVREAIEKGEDNIKTCCLNFASFDQHRKGYDVVVLMKNGKQVVLSELLENNRPYIDKEIRFAHNISKLLVARSIRFLEPKSNAAQ